MHRHEYSMVSYWIGLTHVNDISEWDDEDTPITYTAWDQG